MAVVALALTAARPRCRYRLLNISCSVLSAARSLISEKSTAFLSCSKVDLIVEMLTSPSGSSSSSSSSPAPDLSACAWTSVSSTPRVLAEKRCVSCSLFPRFSSASRNSYQCDSPKIIWLRQAVAVNDVLCQRHSVRVAYLRQVLHPP